jgi:predicted molibdopterin-dependent oxidoreductase YjgC
MRDVARVITSAQKPAIVYGKGVTGQGSPQVLRTLIELARLAGAFDADRSAIIGTKGQVNSTGAYMYGLDKIFEVNGHQAVYLALGDDKASRRLLQRLEKAPFIVVQASHLSPVTALADVVLPVEMWAEQEGHYLNLEGRLQKTRRILTPPSEAWSHVEVFQAIATNMSFALDTDWKKALRGQVPTTILNDW